VVKDRDLIAVAGEHADQDIMVMEAITVRLEAVKLRTRAKLMRMTGRIEDLTVHPQSEADASKLEVAAEVLDRVGAAMEVFLSHTADPLAELRDRLAVVRRRNLEVVGDPLEDLAASSGLPVVDVPAAPRMCLAFPENRAGELGRCICRACVRERINRSDP